MDVGLQMVFTGFGWDEISDQQVWDEELKIAEIAAAVFQLTPLDILL